MTTQTTPPKTWQAKWIWGDDDGTTPNSYRYFRKTFEVDEVLDVTRLFISADTRYKLFLNGVMLGEGPPQSQPFYQYYDAYDISASLRQGRNCVAVIVNYVGNSPDTRGGLLLEIDAENRPLLCSDASWSTCVAKAWAQKTYNFTMNNLTPYQEMFDARVEPQGWKTADFDETLWAQTQVLSSCFGNLTIDTPPAVLPWSTLKPRDIPFMRLRHQLPEAVDRVEEGLEIANRMRAEDLSIGLSTVGQPIQYATMESAKALLSEEGTTRVRTSTQHLDGVFDGIYNPSVLLDFGREITAYLEIEVEGPEGGMIDIGYAERLIDKQFNNSLEGQFADRYIMRNGRQVFRSFTWKGFRYSKLLFRDCFEDVIVHAVRAVVTEYPFDEVGAFHSSDEGLNAIYGICRSTLKLCSNEAITDTPWREQGQWLGDVSAITLGGLYACFGETTLASKFLRQSAANQMPTGFLTNITNITSFKWQNTIVDYSLWWINALWEYYLYTGDAVVIHQYYPHALKIFQNLTQYVNADGLLENVPHWIFIDWAYIERRGECAALNGIFYGSLDTLESMAQMKHDSYWETEIAALKTRIKANFQTAFYSAEKGCVVDARIEGQHSEMVSEHANLCAILYDLCDRDTAAQILNTLYVEKTHAYTEAQPFFMYAVLKALDRIGEFSLALDLIRARWGERMVAPGYTSCLEEWYHNGSWRNGFFKGFLRTHSHAWSAFPAEFLMRNLIGLEILEPGCTAISLRPKEVDFDYHVQFPTPQGIIEVAHTQGQTDIQVPEAIRLVKEPGKEMT